MKRDLGPKDLIFPAPVLIVGTYGQDGTPNAMNVAWGGICSSVPPAVAISIRETRRTFANIQAKGAFTVAIANGLTATQLMRAVRPHPTFLEAVGEALDALEGRAIHS